MRNSIILIASLSFLASCDPRVFDDLEAELWVHAGEASGDFDSNQYGLGLVPAGTDAEGQLHYFVLGGSPAGVTRNRFNSAGDVSSVPLLVSDGLIESNAFTGATAVAADVAGFSRVKGNVAVGGFGGGAPVLFMARGIDGVATQHFILAGASEPSGIAFGNTNAGTETDLVALAGDQLNLIAGYQDQAQADTSISCTLGAGGGVLIADVDAIDGEEILVGTGGGFVVLAAQTIVDAVTLDEDCLTTGVALATVTAPRGEASFGAQILLADFDGNDQPDLVVTAPDEQAVYVYLDWTDATSPALSISNQPGNESFGTRAAIGDFDGNGRDELVVSDPGRRSLGQNSAGAVFIFVSDPAGVFADPIVLHDARAEVDQRFGRSVAVSSAFGGDVLIVGAKDEVFTYYRTPVSGDSCAFGGC